MYPEYAHKFTKEYAYQFEIHNATTLAVYEFWGSDSYCGRTKQINDHPRPEKLTGLTKGSPTGCTGRY